MPFRQHVGGAYRPVVVPVIVAPGDERLILPNLDHSMKLQTGGSFHQNDVAQGNLIRRRSPHEQATTRAYGGQHTQAVYPQAQVPGFSQALDGKIQFHPITLFSQHPP